MLSFKDFIKESGGAGDWGTEKARKRLAKDTPGQTEKEVKNEKN